MSFEPPSAGSRPPAGSPRSSCGPPGRGLLGALLLAVLAAGAGIAAAGAQELRPGTALLQIRTECFDIYFPESLRREAGRLASFADGLRDELAAALEIAERRRFPVLLSDAHGVLNGSFSPAPSDRIVLYAAPTELDGVFGNVDDDLRSLFLHELVHALTLSVRSPFWAVGALLLGDPVAPAVFLAPLSIVEGATVSAESAEGFGRVNDPLAAALVRQELLEGRRKGFWQAAGAWDRYPFGDSWYLYGGLFSAWLKERHGEEAYARLWREFGRGGLGSGIEDFLFIKGAFRRAFGEGLDRAWNAFLDETSPAEPVVTKTEPLVREPGYVTALCAGRDYRGRTSVYWNDPFAGGVLAMELEEAPRPGEAPPEAGPRLVVPADGYVNRLDLSPDGRRLLLSSAREEKGFPVLVLKEWDLETGRFVGPEIRGLREASYVREADGGSAGLRGGIGEAGGRPVVAIAAEAYRADLVVLREGRRELLLRGGERRSYGSPAAVGGRIYAIAREAGKRLILRLSEGSADSRPAALRIETLAAEAALPFPRFLSAASGLGPALAFSLAEAGGLYRLALLEDGGEAPELLVQTGELSGGVSRPAALPPAAGPRAGVAESAASGGGGSDFAYRVAHLGSFAEGRLPSLFPRGNPALAPRRVSAAWVALDPSFADPAGAGAAGAPPRPEAPEAAPAPPLPGLLRTFRLPLAGASGVGSDAESGLAAPIDSAGLLLTGRDYAGFLGWEAAVAYGWRSGGADLRLSANLALAPFALALSLADRFVAAPSRTAFVRESSGGLELSYDLAFFPARRRLSLGGFAAAAAFGEAFAPGAAAGTAYALPYEAPSLLGGLRAGYRDLRGSMRPPFAAQGLAAGLELGAELPVPLAPAAAASAPALSLGLGGRAALAALRLELLADGALSLDGRSAWSPGAEAVRAGEGWSSSAYRPRVPRYAEYGGLEAFGALYLAGRAELGLASLEIQERLPLLAGAYARRLTIAGGLRGAWIGARPRPDGSLSAPLDGLALGSAYLRAVAELAPTFGFGSSLGLRLGAEIAYAFREDLVASPVSLNLIVELAD